MSIKLRFGIDVKAIVKLYFKLKHKEQLNKISATYTSHNCAVHFFN